MQLKLINNISNAGGNIKRLDVDKIKPQQSDKVRPFLRYPGSKYNASKYIAPFWSNIEFEEYREPFLGSGAIFFKMPKAYTSWLNDIDRDLINSFQVVSNPKLREKLIKKIENISPSKKLFQELKEWNPKTKIDKAYRYFVINRTAYSGIMNLPNWGFHPTKSVQPEKWADRLLQAGEKLEDKVKITSVSFLELIKKPSNKKVWLFIDPPYYKADQK